MEVHNHPHIHHSKKWKDYLYEFLMLFLAISLGFFVENQREHFIENKREKQFIRSMISDLNTDIKVLDSILKLRYIKQIMIDSMLFILNSPDPDAYGAQLYYYARRMPRVIKFISSDGTLLQLKNAGNLRLIRDPEAAYRIMAYDQIIQNWKTIDDREETLIQQYYPALKTMFDARVFETMVDGMKINRPSGTPRLLISDKKSLFQLFSHIHFLKNVNTYDIQLGSEHLKAAKSTLTFLKNEYHIK